VKRVPKTPPKGCGEKKNTLLRKGGRNIGVKNKDPSPARGMTKKKNKNRPFRKLNDTRLCDYGKKQVEMGFNERKPIPQN